MTIRVAIAGLGKIARDQHVPALTSTPMFELVATVDPNGDGICAVPSFRSVADLAEGDLGVDAVAVCTPPQVRYAVASAALRAGLHVLLEKPPAASLSEVHALKGEAMDRGLSLFAAWHSRYAAGVAPARAWLANRRLTGGTITWREDVRVWHPGQRWIFEAGGTGVFDPGINALSILTAILPEPPMLRGAELEVPSNADAPISARLDLATASGAVLKADFDFRQTGRPTWNIELHTDDGLLVLSDGGRNLSVPGAQFRGPDDEYRALYRDFASLIGREGSDCDDLPLCLVADAFLRGRIITTDPFFD